MVIISICMGKSIRMQRLKKIAIFPLPKKMDPNKKGFFKENNVPHQEKIIFHNVTCTISIYKKNRGCMHNKNILKILFVSKGA